MQIIGHKLIDYKPLLNIKSKDELTSENVLYIFKYDLDLISFMKEKNLPFCLYIDTEEEAIYGNAFGAKLLVCSFKASSNIQKLAEYYLFDAKIAVIIKNKNDMQKAIKKRLDAVILKEAFL